jgi:hypothetical protein
LAGSTKEEPAVIDVEADLDPPDTADRAGGGERLRRRRSGGPKIAYLLPENETPRCEVHDRPEFEENVEELCEDCEILYNNATEDASKQQSQAEAALTQGGSELLLAIAGPVIAGTSLFGGRGAVWTALRGALVIGSISNGMDLLALSSGVKFMVTGGVLLIAVLIDAIARKERQAAGRV